LTKQITFLLILSSICFITIPCYSDPKPFISNSPDDYIAFVETINNMFIDTNYKSISIDTTGHPSFDSLIKLSDNYSSIIYKKNKDSKLFAGIGIYFKQSRERPTITLPIENGPAYKANLSPGDTILMIDNHPTRGISLDSSICLLRGDSGTFVSLQIKRSNDTLLFKNIQRDFITIQNISNSLMIYKHIGYIRIQVFTGVIPFFMLIMATPSEYCYQIPLVLTYNTQLQTSTPL
jgi:hypothetical protein